MRTAKIYSIFFFSSINSEFIKKINKIENLFKYKCVFLSIKWKEKDINYSKKHKN